MAEINNKVCPHCGGKMFLASITRGCVVEAVIPNEENESGYKILKEGEDKYDIEIVKCARCKLEVTEKDLVEGIKCNECGAIVSPSDLNQDGLCNVCVAKKQRSELANASKEDLIRMLLEAEKKADPVAARMEKQMDIAANVTVNTVSDVTEVTTDEQSEEVTKPRRRQKAPKSKSKDVEVTEEVTTETEAQVENNINAPEDIVAEEKAIDDIANQQEAPFPDVNLPEPEQISVSESSEEQVSENTEQPIGNQGFSMFDDNEEPF